MRLRNRPRLLLACCFFLFWPSLTSLHAQIFNLETNREPITSLDGLWRFHIGDNPQWASPNFDDSQWPLLRSDESWTKQGYPDYSGYAWYRFTIQVPDGNKPLAMRLTPILTGYQVYANGKLIGGNGSITPTRNPVLAALPAALPLPAGGAGPQTIQIAIRVWHYKPFANFFGGGTLEASSAVGDRSLILRRLQRDLDANLLRRVNDYAYGLLAAIVGITILVLFLFRRKDREYLWFSILLLAEAAGSVPDMILSVSPIPISVHDLLNDIATAVSVVAALAFFSIVLNVRRSFLWWIACVAAAATPLLLVAGVFQWITFPVTNVIGLCCLLPAFIWILVALAIRAFKRDTSARLLLGPAALFYGYGIVSEVVNITWQFGWQTKRESPDIALLLHPFPLHLQDLINYLFVLALLIFLVRRFALARQEETRLSTEMEAARSMQSLLVPATAPDTPGFKVESVYLPASEVGGDFFQVQPGDNGSLLIVVGDVSGKGLKAAMTVSTIVGALRDYPAREPAEILAHLNRVLHGQITGFVTCCVTLISAHGAMTIANAGHLSPYLNSKEMNVSGGLPLGILADGSYEETQYQLVPDDRLTFMSDGVIEARNHNGELYGFERTQQISHQPAAYIANAAKDFGQEDDITVLSIEYAGAEVSVNA